MNLFLKIGKRYRIGEDMNIQGYLVEQGTVDSRWNREFEEQLNDFERGLLNFYKPIELYRLQQTVIAICGAGGIGSNCAMSLARSGMCQFIIIDMDCVEWSNLNRQAYFPYHVGRYKVDALEELLKSINPHITVQTHRERLTKENVLHYVSGAHILVEAFDDVTSKADFYNATSQLVMPRIMVSGVAGVGGASPACVKKMGKNLYIVGDGKSSTEYESPYAPRVTMAANQQADVVLSLVLGKEVFYETL